MNTNSKIVSALFATLLFAGCGNGVNGTYALPHGNGTLTLSSGKAELASPDHDQTMEMDYVVEGDKVILKDPSGSGKTRVLTRKPDGSLRTPWGTIKKK